MKWLVIVVKLAKALPQVVPSLIEAGTAIADAVRARRKARKEQARGHK